MKMVSVDFMLSFMYLLITNPSVSVSQKGSMAPNPHTTQIQLTEVLELPLSIVKGQYLPLVYVLQTFVPRNNSSTPNERLAFARSN